MKLYSYYLLAFQNWCSSQGEYKIHGLWSDINSTTYPSFCTQVPFNLTELEKSDKYELIQEYWTDCNYADTIALYEHEWDKHGTCVALQSGYSQNEYFEKTISLYEIYNKNDGKSVCFDLDFIQINCDLHL